MQWVQAWSFSKEDLGRSNHDLRERNTDASPGNLTQTWGGGSMGEGDTGTGLHQGQKGGKEQWGSLGSSCFQGIHTGDK